MTNGTESQSNAKTLINRVSGMLQRVISGIRGRKLWACGAGLVVLGLGVFASGAGRSSDAQPFGKGQPAPLTASAVLGPFLQQVIERGEVESSSNVEIRCMVQSRLAAGIAIIEIAPEGTYVKEGDFLVKLDDSTLQTELVQQQIAANTSRAIAVEAKADYEAAKLALQEYEAGMFRQELGALQGEEFVARENLRRAEEYLRYSQKLAARGYVTEVQLEADRFAVEKARNELTAAQTKLEVLHRYTKRKTINKLTADVGTAEARLKSRENSHNLDLERLKTIEDQLAKCIIKAPTSGQVVYANPASGEPLIAEGKLVRERQVMIRLPDPKRMQVTARVNESRIDRVRTGMLTRIRLDAFPAMELVGKVREVSEYPLPSSSPYSLMKEYAAAIDIIEPPAGVRTGMTAQAAIEVEKLDEAVQVPLQAVIERDSRYFCIVEEDGNYVPRELTVGRSNDQAVVISDGLEPGEKVVLSPHTYEAHVSFETAAPVKVSTEGNLATNVRPSAAATH